ncbi:hypothetical protein C2R22_00035 [Salinigranum rubrum]|uniref:Pyrrolo-quinoline quinone repeat domain-containing protein n=1 Tax=Salinigranum rubrum TaxID=755307 RepID=A0A2I8VE98_9EURY|nr:PQQ-binding-like beta-propeller repeat protein [Salinigranum rubrum]AUV80252.1 hypothetical protein C2R22_00035 [Salinigranum rubrum]
MVNRRAFLASLGTLVGAGCATRSDTESPAEPTPEPTAEPTTTPTVSATRPDERAAPDSVDSAWPMPAHDSGRSNFSPDATGPTTLPADLWSVPFEASLSDPVVADGTVYVGGDDGAVRALDARTGAEQWTTALDAPAETPWVVGDRLFVPTPGAVVALDADGGGSVRRFETPARSDFVAARHGLYYVDASGPTVVALERSGERRWEAEINEPWQSPLLTSDEHVFVSTGAHWNEPWTFAVDTGQFEWNRRPEPGGSDMIAERFVSEGTVFAVDPMFGEVEAAVVDSGGTTRSGVRASTPTPRSCWRAAPTTSTSPPNTPTRCCTLSRRPAG